MGALWQGLLIGAFMGISFGPIAMLGADARHEGYRRAGAFLLGGSMADFVLIVVAAQITSDIQLSPWFLRSISLTVIGVTMLASAYRGTKPLMQVRHGYAFVTAFIWTAPRPDTVCAVLMIMRHATALSPLLYAGGALGVTLGWAASIETLFRVRRRAGKKRPALLKLVGCGCFVGALGSLVIGYTHPSLVLF